MLIFETTGAWCWLLAKPGWNVLTNDRNRSVLESAKRQGSTLAVYQHWFQKTYRLMIYPWFQLCSLVSTVETDHAACFWLHDQRAIKNPSDETVALLTPRCFTQSWGFMIWRWSAFCGTETGRGCYSWKSQVSLMLACVFFLLMHHMLYHFRSLTWIHSGMWWVLLMINRGIIAAMLFFPEPFKSKLQRWFLFISKYSGVRFLKKEKILLHTTVQVSKSRN